MSTPITPVATIPPATYPIPAPGEGVTSANTSQYVQPITNSIEWVRARVPGANPPSAQLRIPASSAEKNPEGTAQWVRSDNIHTAVDVSFPGISIWFTFTLIPGTIIRTYRCYIKGGSGHSSYPGSLSVAYLTLFYIDHAVGSLKNTVDYVNDGATSVSAYESYHVIQKTLSTPQAVSVTQQYYLRFTQEAGTGALVGTQVYSASLDVSSL